jgi:hypothetical protein
VASRTLHGTDSTLATKLARYSMRTGRYRYRHTTGLCAECGRPYRPQRCDSKFMVAVEIDGIDGAVVDMLIGNDWLTKAESHDGKKIAKAIARNAGGSGDAVIILLKLAV